MPDAPPVSVRPRIAATGRRCHEPPCAGCAQLATLRALRRAGLRVHGALGCEEDDATAFRRRAGRWAALAGVARLADVERLVAETLGAGAHLLVVADRTRPPPAALRLLSAPSSAPVVRVDPADPLAVEAAVTRLASAPPGSIVIAAAGCARDARDARAGAPRSVDAARCNRCGACLSLGCAALADVGGEGMVIDPALCAGCGLCAALCRARAIG